MHARKGSEQLVPISTPVAAHFTRCTAAENLPIVNAPNKEQHKLQSQKANELQKTPKTLKLFLHVLSSG